MDSQGKRFAANVITKNFPVPRAIRRATSLFPTAARQGAPAGPLLPMVTQGKRNAAGVILNRHPTVRAKLRPFPAVAHRAAKVGSSVHPRPVVMRAIRLITIAVPYPVIRLILRG